jgi:hypothetical protein
MVICIGLNKTGTKTLEVFFKKNFSMERTLHSPKKFTKWVMSNMESGRDILYRLNYEFFSDIFFSSNHEVNRYLRSQEYRSKIIRKLYEQYPGVNYIINYRDKESWLKSREKHVIKNKRNQRYRNRNADNLWLEVDKEGWSKEYDEHYEFCRSFFADKKALWLNIVDGDKPKKLLNFLGFPNIIEEFDKINVSKL